MNETCPFFFLKFPNVSKNQSPSRFKYMFPPLLTISFFFFKKVTQHTHTPRINKSTRACLSAHIARISPCTRNERLYLKNASLEHLVNVQRSHEEVPCGSLEAMTMTDYDRENEFWFARRLDPFFFFTTR